MDALGRNCIEIERNIKMDVLEKARELGEMLADSEEYKRMKAAEAAKNADETAIAMLADYNRKANEFAAKVQAAQPTPEELEEYRVSLGNAFAELDANAVVHEFLEATKAFDDMMKNINSIIAFYVVPERQGGSCSGDCSSCGGCN